MFDRDYKKVMEIFITGITDMHMHLYTVTIIEAGVSSYFFKARFVIESGSVYSIAYSL